MAGWLAGRQDDTFKFKLDRRLAIDRIVAT
jgi:hypothetical protein